MYYLAERIEDLPEPYVPSDKKQCSRCGKEVWVSKIGYAASGGNLPCICMPCAGAMAGASGVKT